MQKFKECDPFNENIIEGLISRRADDTYGTLYIYRVNGANVPQVIEATPKLIYPFGKDSDVFHWDTNDLTKVEVYNKLDGTNIFAYKYYDIFDNEYISYKLRMRPFVVNSKWGDFKDWVFEMRDRYPIDSVLKNSNFTGMSFELYGKQNTILVKYDVDLDIRLLFCRDGRAIKLPDKIDNRIPKVKHITSFDKSDNLKDKYHEIRCKLNDQAEKTDDNKIEGTEGCVIYLVRESGCKQYKCKPDAVLDFHWKDGLGKNSIRTTCINAYENCKDDPSLDQIKDLLLEEFTEHEVNQAEDMIEKVLFEVIKFVNFKEEIIKLFNDNNLEGNGRGNIMRYYSKLYDNEKCGKIYSILAEEGLI